MPICTANGNLRMIPVFLRFKINYVRTGAGKQPALLSTTQKIHTIVLQNDQDEFFAYAFLRPQESTQAGYAAVQRRNLVAHRAYWGESLIPYGRENTTSASKNGPTTRAWQMGSSCLSHAKKIGLKPKAKSQWDCFHPVGWNYFIGIRWELIARIDPRQDPDFSLKKWITTCQK